MWGSGNTGIGTYIEQLFENYISEFQKNPDTYPFRYVVFVIDSATADKLAKHKNLITPIVAPYHWYTWEEQLKFYALLRKYNLDLMHFPNFNFPVLYGKPFVVTIHDLILRFFPGHKRGKNPIRRAGFSFAMDQAIYSSSHIICVSEYTKNDIMRHYKVPFEKLSVIYEGVKQLTPTKPLERKEILSKFHIRPPYLFYAGLWIKHKNLPTLVKALWLVRKKYDIPMSLVLGGNEDPYYPDTRNTWNGLRLGSHVKRPGFIEGANLSTLYQEAFCTVLPSFYEGFGFIGLESMQAGTPVISSSSASLPEVFGDAALYFNPHDPYELAQKIADLYKSKSLQRTLVSRGREHIEKFSWESCARETEQLYERLVK